uniref:RING-type domain-containing protein n=1 Tax=Zooxanthella nutricula TaxID=1333877 RepID=A0A6U9ARD8_9DINO|mmetsp:Transcript_69789/g.214008  ORF Transcript_69789/g.214008 Transcript_69789/m.214008 type:complete len:284 (+) Transcript_69789:104-955(+)
MTQSLGYNDGILFVSLLYSCVDLAMEWATFAPCAKPIHKWLLVSYVCVLVFRLVHIAGSRAASAVAGDFLLDMRLKGAGPRFMAAFIWAVALPFFTFWTLLGTAWFWRVASETPQCMPSETHFWFSAFWLFLCYAWIVIHSALGVVAWVLERRVRRAEGDLRSLEDDDVLRRWGEVSQIPNFQSLSSAAGPVTGQGLSAESIKALPSAWTLGAESDSFCGECTESGECPICINDLEPGDTVRRLPGCGHTFHRSCIDLWLLRRADCPLCKRAVAAGRESGEWV